MSFDQLFFCVQSNLFALDEAIFVFQGLCKLLIDYQLVATNILWILAHSLRTFCALFFIICREIYLDNPDFCLQFVLIRS
jgi:hypothetical protein